MSTSPQLDVQHIGSTAVWAGHALVWKRMLWAAYAGVADCVLS